MSRSKVNNLHLWECKGQTQFTPESKEGVEHPFPLWDHYSIMGTYVNSGLDPVDCKSSLPFITIRSI